MIRLQELTERYPLLNRVMKFPKSIQLVALSGIVTLVVGAFLLMRGPSYKVLFSNLGDKDGGTIVAALDKLNVPHTISENGAAILVPADKVHATRLKLAEQGLPQGGNVGFELMENPKFGASQFAEQVTYQRAVEGELSRSIEAMYSITGARVHLAIPKQTLFVRERKSPTASVLLTLAPGRTLGDGQIAAIAWLVASSVPDLTAENVSIVDQAGRLLSSKASSGGQDANQSHLKYTSDLEQRTAARVLSILTPMVGAGNAHTEVSAEIDFDIRELTSETYRPNQKPESAAVRSEQTNRAAQHGVTPAMGVPGALANEPPPSPAAPIVKATDEKKDEKAETGPSSTNDSATINYEVDRTISHTKEAVGRLKRLSVAVVVNYRPDAQGELQPLNDSQIAEIQHLVKEAIGYSADRGDSLKVANVPFTNAELQLPLWKDPFYLDMTKSVAQTLMLLGVLLLVWFKFIKPLIRRSESVVGDSTTRGLPETGEQAQVVTDRYENNLTAIRKIALQDARAASMVIRNWINENAE